VKLSIFIDFQRLPFSLPLSPGFFTYKYIYDGQAVGKRSTERKITEKKTYGFKTKNLNSRPKTTAQEMPTVASFRVEGKKRAEATLKIIRRVHRFWQRLVVIDQFLTTIS
jgi:hypothetical protein